MIEKGNAREQREVEMCVVGEERVVGTVVETAKVTANVGMRGDHELVPPRNTRAHGSCRAWTI